MNKTKNDDFQLSIFNMDNPKLEEIKDDILSLDLDQITPVEALIKLNEIKRILNCIVAIWNGNSHLLRFIKKSWSRNFLLSVKQKYHRPNQKRKNE